MPAWLIAALVAARQLTLGTGARGLATGVGVGSLLPDFGIPGFGGDDKPRRRRRRRALTASDRADIAFIAGSLGQAAGKQFALIIASRTG